MAPKALFALDERRILNKPPHAYHVQLTGGLSMTFIGGSPLPAGAFAYSGLGARTHATAAKAQTQAHSIPSRDMSILL